jgi:hypothetical protein
LTVSRSDEWDDLFKILKVANIAYKVNLIHHSGIHSVDRYSPTIDLNNSLEEISEKIKLIGKTPSWSNELYGKQVRARVVQMCNTLMELN